MKKISAVWLTGIFLLIGSITTLAQNIKTTLIEPQPLQVTYAKTTNLIFPYAIKSIDKGSQDILVQKAIGVENVLQVKAAKKAISETNLTIVTADGSLYSYVVNYSESPQILNIKVQNDNVFPNPVAVFTGDATTDAIASTAQMVNSRQGSIKRIDDENFGVELALKGLYIRQDVMYFQLSLRNSTNLNYDIEQLRFLIRDRKKSKRTSSQENELSPIHVNGNMVKVPALSQQVLTIAVPKFTMADNKFLSIQLMEKNGGRNLSLKISNKVLMRATLLQ